MPKPFKQPILTTYSDLWITGEFSKKTTSKKNLKDGETVLYRPKQFTVTYKNKHVGVCVDIKSIPLDWSPKEIMQRMSTYAGKNVINISTINASYPVIDGVADFSKEIRPDVPYTMPIFSKKGTNLMQIDVNFLAILTISDMYQLQDKWMSDSLSYFGQEWKDRKYHSDLFAPDSLIKRATEWTSENSSAPYISPMRPSLNKLETIK